MNWRLVVEHLDAPDSPRFDWRNKGIDGLIVASHGPADAHLADMPFPVVNITGLHAQLLPTVNTDDHAVGRKAAVHLMYLPLVSFAYLGWPGRVYSAERGNGFAAALRAAGHACHALESTTISEILPWFASLPKPVGLFVANDLHAANLLRACHAHHLDLRQQVALVGVDNDTHICDYTQPTLTSIEQRVEMIATQAAAMLRALMAGQPIARRQFVPPGELVIRDSTRFQPIDAEMARALTLIRENASQLAGVEDLLNHLPLSRRTLERRFRQVLGKSPRDEINRVRLAEARRLLAATDLSVEEIARRTGFTSASWLGKAMRAHCGQTPTAYRRLAASVPAEL